MPTLRRTLVHNWGVTDDATFRTWGKAISDGLVAVGLNRTTAIDWTSVLRPATSMGAGPTETFAFGGPLQAAYPIVVTLAYTWSTTPGGGVVQARVQSNTAYAPGSTTLHTLTTTNAAYAQGSKDATSYLASDGENWLSVALGVELASSGNGVLVVERYRAADGSYDAEGAYVVAGVSTSTGGVSMGSAGGSVAISSIGVPVAFPGGGTSSLKRGEVALYPHTALHAGQPPQVVFSGLAGDYSTQERVTLSDGRAYLALPASAANHYANGSTSTSIARLMVRNDGAAV